MTVRDLQDLIAAYLALNDGPGYRVAVTDISPDHLRAKVTVTFVSGRSYCCAEPGCHLPWEMAKVIDFAAQLGLVVPLQLTIQWHVVVEEGALLACNRPLSGSLASEHFEYDHVTS